MHWLSGENAPCGQDLRTQCFTKTLKEHCGVSKAEEAMSLVAKPIGIFTSTSVCGFTAFSTLHLMY